MKYCRVEFFIRYKGGRRRKSWFDHQVHDAGTLDRARALFRRDYGFNTYFTAEEFTITLYEKTTPPA